MPKKEVAMYFPGRMEPFSGDYVVAEMRALLADRLGCSIQEVDEVRAKRSREFSEAIETHFHLNQPEKEGAS